MRNASNSLVLQVDKVLWFDIHTRGVPVNPLGMIFIPKYTGVGGTTELTAEIWPKLARSLVFRASTGFVSGNHFAGHEKRSVRARRVIRKFVVDPLQLGLVKANRRHQHFAALRDHQESRNVGKAVEV